MDRPSEEAQIDDQAELIPKELLDREVDEDLSTWVLNTLNQQHPGVEIDDNSVKALTVILDGLTKRVLEVARTDNVAEGAGADTKKRSRAPLTSLDISRAVKRVLPGEPGEKLRPYLPSVTKQAWALDKKSLKGIKKQKLNGGENQQGGTAPALATENGDQENAD